MNNEPVAWMHQNPDYAISKHQSLEYNISLYTHPVKELKNIVVASATCSCGKVMEVTNLQPVKELTDEEISEVFKDCTKDGILDANEFARAILRKAQEK